MFEKLIKDKTKKIYIRLFILCLIFVFYNGYQKYSSVKVVNYSNLKAQIITVEKQNSKLKQQFKEKKMTFKLITPKLINSKKLKKEISELFDGLIKNKIITRTDILNIDTPHDYLNVAQVTIQTNNAVDMLIIKRLLGTIYNIKSINSDKTLLIVQIYKDI